MAEAIEPLLRWERPVEGDDLVETFVETRGRAVDQVPEARCDLRSARLMRSQRRLAIGHPAQTLLERRHECDRHHLHMRRTPVSMPVDKQLPRSTSGVDSIEDDVLTFDDGLANDAPHLVDEDSLRTTEVLLPLIVEADDAERTATNQQFSQGRLPRSGRANEHQQGCSVHLKLSWTG